MDPRFTYCIILACSLAGPLALSFDRKVAFFKKWKYLFPAMLFPAALYIAWDVYFTSTGIWRFNENYITGIRFFNLPLEEVLFFFVVPYCCVFIYECVRCYFPNLRESRKSVFILLLLGVLLLGSGFFYYNRHYTSWTFTLNGLFIIIIFLRKAWFRNFNSAAFLFSWLIILVPFLAVNGFLTAIPVVIYNNAENLGIRIFSIPFEDIFYGMLLILLNIVLFEKLRSRLSKT